MTCRNIRILLAVVSASLLLTSRVAADDVGPVGLQTGEGNTVRWERTGSRFCERLVLRETGGSNGVKVTLKALPWTNETGTVVQPGLSQNRCDAAEVQDNLMVELARHQWRDDIYISATLPEVATYSGQLVLEYEQPTDQPPSVVDIEVTRKKRTLTVSPTEDDNNIVFSTFRVEDGPKLYLGLEPGQADITDLTYKAWFDPGQNGQVRLEQDGKQVTGPLSLTSQADLEFDLVATLPKPRDEVYTGRLVFSYDGEEYPLDLAFTRASRTLIVRPVEDDNRIVFSTLKREDGPKLRLRLSPGQPAITDLTYQAWFDPGQNGQVRLERDDEPITEPLTLTSQADLELKLVATLPEAREYTGRLVLNFDGGERELDLAFTRESTKLTITGAGIDGDKLTLSKRLDEFEHPLRVELPEGADPVEDLTYSVGLLRADSTGERVPPTVTLLCDNEDVNEITLPLEPGKRKILTLKIELPEVLEYNGWLQFDLGEARTQDLTLTLKREAFDKATGLEIVAPTPIRWQTPPLFWLGIVETMTLELNESSGQNVTFNEVKLAKLDRVDTSGNQIENLLEMAPVPARVEPSKALTVAGGGRGEVTLQISNLSRAGSYKATVRATGSDGREIEGEATFSVRHHWLFPLLCLLFGTLLAWFLQYWAGGGKARAVALYKVSKQESAIAQGKEKFKQLPKWVDQSESDKMWEFLRSKLDEKVQDARLDGSAADIETAATSFEAKARYLHQGLALLGPFNEAIHKHLSKGDQEKWKRQVNEWLTGLDKLYQRIRELEGADLDDSTKGAPKILGDMRAGLTEVKQQELQAYLTILKEKLQAIGGESEGLKALKAKANAIAQEKLTAEASEKLKTGEYAKAQDLLNEANAECAGLYVDQMKLQLEELENQGARFLAQDPEAIQAIRAARELVLLPEDATATEKMEAYEKALLPYTRAQAKVMQARLGARPEDVTDAEWQALDSYSDIKRHLEDALGALQDAEQADGEKREAHLADGQGHYEQAVKDWPWLRRDLMAKRLKRLPDQLPEGVGQDDPEWTWVRDFAADEFTKLPRKGTVAEVALLIACSRALDPLLERLRLAACSAATACKGRDDEPLPEKQAETWAHAVHEFKRKLQIAFERRREIQAVEGGSGPGLVSKLDAAEHSYEEAYRTYEEVTGLCSGFREPRKGIWYAPFAPATFHRRPELRAGFAYRSLEKPPAPPPGDPPPDEGPPSRVDKKWVLFYGIRLLDLASIPVALAVSVIVGMATKVVDQATFGSFKDYAIVALWGFGVQDITSYLTEATWSQVKEKVLKKE